MIDPRLVHFVAKLEGFREHAYRCSAKVWTIGYGQTTWHDGQPIGPADFVKESYAREWLVDRLTHDRAKVVSLVGNDELPPHAFDAATCFAYNVGIGDAERGFLSSSVYRRLRRGDFVDAGDCLMRWLKQPELKSRREHERMLMQDGWPAVEATEWWKEPINGLK